MKYRQCNVINFVHYRDLNKLRGIKIKLLNKLIDKLTD